MVGILLPGVKVLDLRKILPYTSFPVEETLIFLTFVKEFGVHNLILSSHNVDLDSFDVPDDYNYVLVLERKRNQNKRLVTWQHPGKWGVVVEIKEESCCCNFREECNFRVLCGSGSTGNKLAPLVGLTGDHKFGE